MIGEKQRIDGIMHRAKSSRSFASNKDGSDVEMDNFTPYEVSAESSQKKFGGGPRKLQASKANYYDQYG